LVITICAVYEKAIMYTASLFLVNSTRQTSIVRFLYRLSFLSGDAEIIRG